jgi:hypothetical protein
MVLPVSWLNKKAGDWCEHCNIGVGCSLWGNGVTDECVNFQCIYNELDNLPIELRPDKCKIIFENVDNNIVLGTMHHHYNEAYKNKVIQKELMELYKRDFSVILSSLTMDQTMIFPAKGKKMSEVWSDFQEQLKRKHGGTRIHN